LSTAIERPDESSAGRRAQLTQALARVALDAALVRKLRCRALDLQLLNDSDHGVVVNLALFS
jgi:hypothetical protein